MDEEIMYQKELVKSEARFSFELEGGPEIDVRALSQILNSTVEIIEELVRGEPDAYVNLKITKFSTGSFDVDFHAIAEQTVSLLTNPNALASYLVGGVLGSFKIAKHLKGRKPRQIIKEEDNSIIINDDEESLIVNEKLSDRYFCDNKIEGNIIHIVNNVFQESGRRGFSIAETGRDGEDEMIRYQEDDFHYIKPVVDDMKEDAQCHTFVNTVDAVLIIRKPDLTGDSKWGFVWDKNIEATIADKDWLQDIRKRRFKFGPGMQIPVKLKIEVDIDDIGELIKGSERYTVEEIRGEISELSFGDDQIEFEGNAE